LVENWKRFLKKEKIEEIGAYMVVSVPSFLKKGGGRCGEVTRALSGFFKTTKKHFLGVLPEFTF
jgi:hypothetical protein